MLLIILLMIMIIIIITITTTTNNTGNWNHHQTIQKIPQQHAGKAGNQGTTKKTAILGTAYRLRTVLM